MLFLIWVGSKSYLSYGRQLSFSFISFIISSVSGAPRGDLREKYKADIVVDNVGDGKRVAVYRRVSSTKQVSQGFSLEVQEETLERMVNLNKPSRVYWFSDAGKTGTTFTNRRICDITQLAKDGEINELWVCYIDRLGRNTHDLLDLYNRLTEMGVSIRTPDHLYLPNDLPSLLLAMIQFYGAEDDNKKRSSRVIDSKRKRFREKKWNKGNVPLGYVVEGDWLKKIPGWGPVIRDAFRLFNERGNLSEVARILNALHGSILGKPLETYMLKSILSDSLYTGKPTHLGEIVEDASLSFVEVEVYEESLRKLQEIKKEYERHELGPLEETILEEGCDSEIFKEIWFICEKCGSRLLKNGTVYTKGVKQQILLCPKGCKQWKFPRISEMSKEGINPLNSIILKKSDFKKPSLTKTNNTKKYSEKSLSHYFF